VESFYFLIPIALIFVAIALRFLFWAIHNGQYDNLDTEAHRILFDEDAQQKPKPGDGTTTQIDASKPVSHPPEVLHEKSPCEESSRENPSHQKSRRP
jgi:cbb3-type cytochrome oxidase maturation protein